MFSPTRSQKRFIKREQLSLPSSIWFWRGWCVALSQRQRSPVWKKHNGKPHQTLILRFNPSHPQMYLSPLRFSMYTLHLHPLCYQVIYQVYKCVIG
ncbi:uncharacterized protein LOC111892426 [Lactuca sativa]|uniref:uncharacterized protein LOC111892426 n=1 Tax=Lactuca sativa TaxID=4236 RepID=UPI001C688094|nr:uncharacterized protein LOC111892426 [Lactuca sativa]